MATIALQPALARARAALDRGDGVEAADLLIQALNSPSLKREDEIAIRVALAEAWLLQDDVAKAGAALGRQPDTLREPIAPAALAALWRLHGRIAYARGDQSRAIALHLRALKQAELAHDSRQIGLAHYELGHCYKQVGDLAIVREHIAKAAPALHAAGDRRYLALLHSLSGVALATSGRHEESSTAFRHAERLAVAVQANDVLGIVFNNQANVALIQHRYDQALALAERSTAVQEATGSQRGLAISLATLGQICVRLGDFERAEQVLNRALEVRAGTQFHEITGAVFDSLAQIHLMRGAYETAGECLRRAGEAYGSYGLLTAQWYEWSIRVLEAKLALRRGEPDEALRLATEIAQSATTPPDEAQQAELIACDALFAAGRAAAAERRLVEAGERLDARAAPGAWGEFLRIKGEILARTGRPAEAYHHLAQSANVFELLSERYQAARSHLALGRLAVAGGADATAAKHLDRAAAAFDTLGAARDLEETRTVRAGIPGERLGEFADTAADADAIVRRLVDAAAFPALLERETASAFVEAGLADAAAVFVRQSPADVRLIAWAGCEAESADALARAASDGDRPGEWVVVEPLGNEADGPRFAVVRAARPFDEPVRRRIRMVAAVARQGFDLCFARERPPAPPEPERPSLEPLLPGFLCASPAMIRVAEQVRRLQGNELTVLITGESGTGKELVARAIHVGSLRGAGVFLPYNCTTTTRELADSQLFGHRRGSFTGAVSDQPGIVRTATGGTLFLDEVGDLPIDVQPKLLRFLEQGEIMPVGETRPQRVDVRVLAATNADLEQRVAEGKFREDLYYRLSVIRIHVPPLRDRSDEIPLLSTLFLREASERLGKTDIELGSDTLNLFAQYWWPGNVRQLRNEIQRVVAMSPTGGTVRPEHLSPELAASLHPAASDAVPRRRGRGPAPTLAVAVEQLERELIESTLQRAAGNISEAARLLGLTRRGLYLKLRRLGLESRVEMDTE